MKGWYAYGNIGGIPDTVIIDFFTCQLVRLTSYGSIKPRSLIGCACVCVGGAYDRADCGDSAVCVPHFFHGA